MNVHSSNHGYVTVIRIDRPEKRNAIDAETTRGLDDALNQLEDDANARVGVITGTAEVFSAGSDIVAGTGDPTPRGGEYGIVRRGHHKPLIAAVEGLALGGGFEIAMACDLVVASETASFGLPEVTRGLVAASGALSRAMRCLPLNVARELLMTGRPLDARRAHEIGFVNRLAEPGHAVAVARELADEVAMASPTSIHATLQALEEQWADAEQAGWSATARALERVKAGPDFEEGLAAFAEKRRPAWQYPGTLAEG